MMIYGRKALVRKLALGERGGVAILALVAFMVLALPLSIAAIQTASGLSRTSQVLDNRLEESSCRDSGVEQAIWRLMYESGFADSLTDLSPSTSYTLSECEDDVDITVTCIECGGIGKYYAMSFTNYTVFAGHQIEFKFVTEDSSDEDMWLAYDTAAYSSWLRLPSPSGDMQLHLHNNPTPPTGDTASQHPLPMDENAPVAGILYNYDTDRDSDPGRLIQKSSSVPACDESDPVKYQEWLTDPLATDFDIVGTPEYNFWTTIKNFDTIYDGKMEVCLRDYDGSSYTPINNQTLSWIAAEFASGTWVGAAPGTFDIQATYHGLSTLVRVGVADTPADTEILSWQTQ